MESVNLLRHDDSRKAAEKSAAEAQWSLAEELMFALQMHYQKKTRLVTVGLLEERLGAHEGEFHNAALPSSPAEGIEASGESGEEPPRVQVLEVLSRLKSSLEAGE